MHTDNKMSQPFGKVHPKKTVFQSKSCGTAANDTHGYSLAIGKDEGVYITSHITGKTWTLGWGEAISLAMEAGVDDEEKISRRKQAESV
jgi:hypothetical protein